LNYNSQQQKDQNEEGLEYKENFRYNNGAVYSGQFKNEMRHGYGIQVWPDGARYEGYWQFNKAKGKGKFYHIDGDIYEGEWNDDKANGHGTYIHTNGAKYEGFWKDDLQHGKGKENWADGSKYEGNYVEGKKHGKGTYTWADNSKYTGDWKENKISGYVLLIRGYMNGLTEENMREIGLIIICMEKDLIHGKMVENTLVIIIWIKSMDLENILGQMEENI